ncbi:MAG: cache domain-containing protein [Anaerolineales bacterium]|nr:cache domain-containing protein [Anaerolineales bacterium]
MEFDRQPSQEISESRPIETSLGLKLTLVAVGLLLFGFIVYSVITIRISQGDLVANLESDLTKETADTVALIQTKLEQARFAALNLAIAVESGVSEEADLQQLLETSLAANSQIYGMSIGFEPNQLKPNLSSWAVRYRRTADGNIESIMLDDYFEREWYLHPKSVVDVSLSAPYQDDNTGDGNWIITTSLPFFDDSGGFRGVVSTDLRIFLSIQRLSHLVMYSFLTTGELSSVSVNRVRCMSQWWIPCLPLPSRSQPAPGRTSSRI